MATLNDIPTSRVRGWAIRLAYATIAWNTIEAIVSIAAGIKAGSIGLVSFGTDSIIEMTSASIVVWQFRDRDTHLRERSAVRAIRYAFLALAAYATIQAIYDLATRTRPDPSIVGIAISATSLVVMSTLAAAQRRVGRHLESRTVTADSTQTMLCTYLSAAVLLGLALNRVLGWWWADPAVSLIVAALAMREARKLRDGNTDCCALLFGPC